MLTKEELIKFQDSLKTDWERRYIEFKEKMDTSINALPEYVKRHPKAVNYPVMTGQFEDQTANFCERYVKETGTNFALIPTSAGNWVQIQWR